jgi:hypothetical protein
MTFTRISETEAAYVSSRGTSYRMLSCPDGSGTWMVIPDVVPAQPTFFAVPQKNFSGYEIRASRDGDVILGYAMNLGDAAWPVEEELVRQAAARNLEGTPDAPAGRPEPGRAAREALIRRLCKDYGWLIHQVTPGAEARYILEGYLPGASREDADYAEVYISDHPDLFTRWPQLQPAEIRERNRANSARLAHEARAAFDRGEYELALAMIDDAEWWSAPLPDAGRIRDLIRSRIAAAAAAVGNGGHRDEQAAVTPPGIQARAQAGPLPGLAGTPGGQTTGQATELDL